MIKRKGILVMLILYLTVSGLFVRALLSAMEPPAIDIAAVNRIVKETEKNWMTGTYNPPASTYSYAVLDTEGRLLYQSAPDIPITVYDALRAHEICLDVVVDRKIVGKVIISTGYNSALQARRIDTASLVLLLILFLPIPLLIYLLYLNRKVLRPFREMKDFARHIAAGNLDFPLPMDRNHTFGAFTESFDIMREQLKEARRKEAEAARSKKELTASLSHDIKTPVASIKLTSELMLAMEKEESRRKKLQTIYQKAEQIDRLITDMLQSSLEELGELTVRPTEESSGRLEEVIREADYEGKLEPFRLPGCVLKVDLFRIEQVIGNIINNSYKYAGTPIRISSEITEEGLRLEIMDYGKGVPEEELPYVFSKFYRGSNTEKRADGSGLGLYITRNLMEKMNGFVECFNRENGFSVVLFIPLMRPGI